MSPIVNIRDYPAVAGVYSSAMFSRSCPKTEMGALRRFNLNPNEPKPFTYWSPRLSLTVCPQEVNQRALTA